MLAEFLLVSGWLFWAIAAGVAAVIILMLSVGDDSEGFATFVGMTALVLAALFTDAFVGARPVWLALMFAAYLAAGVLWAIKKWWSYVVERRDYLKSQYDNKVNKTATGNETWEAYSKSRRPTAADNKQRIVSWMALWPFSFTWWAMTWPRRAFSWLYGRLSTLFDRISDKVFAS